MDPTPDQTPPSRHALFPGTFDPVTLGHLDVLERAAAIFDRVTVLVASHPDKTGMFSADERVRLLEESTAGVARLTGVRIARTEGLVVEACERLEADAIVRGVRSGTDFDYELQMANTNRSMLPRIDTVLLATAPQHAHVSSTLVRQIAGMGGDVSTLVPGCVARAINDRIETDRIDKERDDRT